MGAQSMLLSLMEQDSALWRYWPVAQAKDISAAEKLHHSVRN